MDLNDNQIQNGIASGFTGSVLNIYGILTRLKQVCQDKELIKQLQKRKFDLVIVNMGLSNLCASVIPYQLSVPFIRQETAIEVLALRSFVHPAVYPVNILAPGSEEMSYIQRVGNTLFYLLYLVRPELGNPSDIIETLPPDIPRVTNTELKAMTELYLLSYDELIDYHFPVYPNMIPVGGLSTRPADKLTEQLEIFMESARDGAVIVSLGSIITWIPDNVRDKMMSSFVGLAKLKFIFKFGNEVRTDGNVMFMPWIPQNDLLAHHNTKLFITHCGMNANFEALYHGVPMIGLPVFGDQYYNAGKMENKGYGVVLKIYDFTKDDLASAIEHVLGTPSYQENIHNASIIFKNRPQTPTQRAAWWVDHVIKYGGKHLRPPVANIPYHQYMLIDVISGILIMFTAICLACLWCLKSLYKLFRKTKPKRD